MCPFRHMSPMFSYSDREKCEVCGTKYTEMMKCKYGKISSIIAALCLENISFQQLISACRRSVSAAKKEVIQIIFSLSRMVSKLNLTVEK